MNFILSPCGTSLLTNQAEGEDRELLIKHANAKTEDEIPPEDRRRILGVIEKATQLLESSDKSRARILSAELNSIISFYDRNRDYKPQCDFHYLLASDTYLGRQTANAIESWLKRLPTPTSVEQIEYLQAKNYSQFKYALNDIINKLREQFDYYKKSNWKIIFNLTGGFKSVQGFLQALGMLWKADEIIYIFEQSSELISIPKLPIKLDMAVFEDENNLRFFRRLDLSLKIERDEAEKIPQTLLEECNGIYDFSFWGKALWSEASSQLYKEKILQPPTPKIKFGKDFIKSCDKHCDRYEAINKKIDRLAQYMESEDKIRCNLSSFDLKKLQTKSLLPSTHEIDAWSDQDAKRIYCHCDSGYAILDKLDKALH